MSASQISVEQFKTLAQERFGFLEGRGFHHVPALERTSATGSTVVYLGKHLAFIFSLDIRDQRVDAQVTKVMDGEIKRNWEGGYSSGLFTHLAKYAGYRGKPADLGAGPTGETSHDALERMLDGWAELLMQAGESLLCDRPDSLPARFAPEL